MPPENVASSPRRTLLLHNIFNYGHFLVYASVLTKWALSRGMDVHMMGRGLVGSLYARRYSGHSRVILHDSPENERFVPDSDTLTRPAILKEALDALLTVQRSLSPDITLLLGADDYLFEDIGIDDPSFSFASPTHGVITFGNREHYTAFADIHARRLKDIITRRSPYIGLLTLDEYHTSDTGSSPDYLHFMPDIFAEGQPDVFTTPQALELVQFLDRGKGPVVPILGKFDQRKNNLWILEAVRELSDVSCVICGERRPTPEDGRIDDLLDELRNDGRLFESYGFVQENLFHLALGHERTRFLPLPYCCHFGSSGIQLLGLFHEKPTLAPTGGLMARRIHHHGLGMTYRSGAKSDFNRSFRELLEAGPEPYRENCRHFMSIFTDDSRGLHLDHAFGISAAGEAPPAALLSSRSSERAVDTVLTLFWRETPRPVDIILEQLELFDLDDPSALMCKALVLLNLGRPKEAREAVSRSLALGGADQFDFILRSFFESTFDVAEDLLDSGKGDEANRLVCNLLEFLPENHPESRMLTRLQATDRVTQADIVMARTGHHQAAVDCFREAIARKPDSYDVYLNLSDVLRYAKRYEESLDVLDELGRLTPDWHGIHHKRGQVLFEMGRLDEALPLFLAEQVDSKHRNTAMAYVERVRDGQS